jgi:DNA-binding Lrp family transcriptional regulator
MSLFYRVGILVAMLISFLSGFGQTKAQKIYDRYSNEAGFTYFSFSKSMIDAMNLNLDEEGKKITGDFKEFKIMIYNEEKGKMKDFSTAISKELAALRYEQVHPKDEKPSDDADFFVEGNGKNVTECHIVVGNKGDSSNSALLISFYGNFKIEDLDKLEKIAHKQSK